MEKSRLAPILASYNIRLTLTISSENRRPETSQETPQPEESTNRFALAVQMSDISLQAYVALSCLLPDTLSFYIIIQKVYSTVSAKPLVFTECAAHGACQHRDYVFRRFGHDY